MKFYAYSKAERIHSDVKAYTNITINTLINNNKRGVNKLGW